jgi:hypothetical protein
MRIEEETVQIMKPLAPAILGTGITLADISTLVTILAGVVTVIYTIIASIIAIRRERDRQRKPPDSKQ